MQAEPLLHWSEPLTQFIGFIALFLAAGAVGFRYAAVRNRLPVQYPDADLERTVYAKATRRAATLGLLGATVQAVLLVMQLPHMATRAHLSIGQLVTTDLETAAKCALLLAAISGFAFARGGGVDGRSRQPGSSADSSPPSCRAGGRVRSIQCTLCWPASGSAR